MNNADAVEIDDSTDSIVIDNSSSNNNQDVLYSSDDDDFDFKKSKIPRLDEDATNSKATTRQIDEKDEEFCPICLDHWTSAGAHRLVCLKCGHLFGESCIEKWLQTNPKCPQCNHPNKTRDIRRLYAKSFKVLDNTELTQALKDVDAEKSLRKTAEISKQEMKLQYQQLSEKFNLVKDELDRYKAVIKNGHAGAHATTSSVVTSSDKSYSSLTYGLDKTINITEISGCRIVTFSPRYLTLLVSQPSSLSLFPGFGIKKINFLDYKMNQYIPVHTKAIRDMAINTLADDGIVLTCGMDKLIKLTNMNSCSNIHSYECPTQIWSCTYNTDNPLYFYAGLANGKVFVFDKRKIDKQVEELNQESGTFAPASSLQFIPKSANSTLPPGLLVSQLDKLSFYEILANGDYKYHPLLMEGPFVSASFEPTTRNLLVTTRPSQKYPSVRHLVYEMVTNTAFDDSTYSLSLAQTFIGSPVQKLLSKSKLFYYNSQLCGCLPDEPTKSALVWDVNRNETIAKLANSGEILDVCPIQYNNTHYISTLTDKQLRVFKRNDM